MEVSVDHWVHQSISFDYDDFVDHFVDLYDEYHEHEMTPEEFVRHVLLQEGFDYVAECDNFVSSPTDESGFEIEIDD